MKLLLQLTQLSPDTEDWIEIIDKAGQELMDAGDAAATICLYRRAVENHPNLRDFNLGLAWSLCRGGKSNEALPLMEKAIETEPDSPELLNDHGWALLEAGRIEEAQAVLEKAVELSPDGYTLPKKNLALLLELRKKNPS